MLIDFNTYMAACWFCFLDLQAHLRRAAGTDIHSFKFAADFDTPLENLLALSREFDLTSTWNSYVLDSIILEEPSIFESTVYSGSWLPFPFPAIDVVVQARGFDLADVSAPQHAVSRPCNCCCRPSTGLRPS